MRDASSGLACTIKRRPSVPVSWIPAKFFSGNSNLKACSITLLPLEGKIIFLFIICKSRRNLYSCSNGCDSLPNLEVHTIGINLPTADGHSGIRNHILIKDGSENPGNERAGGDSDGGDDEREKQISFP